MTDTVQTKTVGPLTITISYDLDAQPPYEPYDCDPWGYFATFERNTTLSDGHPFDAPPDALAFAKEKGWEVFPLYKFEHSGVAYSISAFTCPWDSGQVGYVLVDPKECTNPEKYAKGVCEEIGDWCNGNVYGFIIEDDDGENLESCWGFYGLDYCMDEASGLAESINENVARARVDRLKTMIRNRVPLELRGEAQ